MIITRTPFRISFFGGGTDYPAWYQEEPGAVLSTTIDKYCHITCRYLPPFFGIKHRIVWRHVETVESISDILHPAVRACLRYLQFDDTLGLEIHYQGDLPARSGMGSSSAFAVGLIKGLTALRGHMVTRNSLALKAIELEQEVLKEKVGCQDQIAAAYGGFNVIRFLPDRVFRVEPMTLSPSRVAALNSRLLLFYTGLSRYASEIAEQVVANLKIKRDALHRMHSMVDEAVAILDEERDLDDFGRLLHESWLLKRGLSPLVSNPHIDSIYDTARQHGALGGKLLGAGSSGFMIFYVPENRQVEVLEALSSYLHVPFRFEREGSSVIHYGTDGEDATKIAGSASRASTAPQRNGLSNRVVQY